MTHHDLVEKRLRQGKKRQAQTTKADKYEAVSLGLLKLLSGEFGDEKLSLFALNDCLYTVTIGFLVHLYL